MSIQVQTGSTFAGHDTLEVHTCGECGVMWAMPVEMIAARRRDGKSFYCPNGHCRCFRETEADRLRRSLEHERSRSGRIAAARDQAQASLRAQKGVTTKLRKRIAAGICPCCKRSFRDLGRHMAGQHPDFAGLHE
jgi:hypothetical protein